MSIGDEKILIVDDDRSVVEILSLSLQDIGMNVIGSDDAITGFELFEREKPDLVVIDGLLPVSNGFEFASRIRKTQHGSNIPIMMISGIYRSVAVADQLKELQINDFCEKPIDVDMFTRRVQELLDVYVEAETFYQVDDFRREGLLEDVTFGRLLYLLLREKLTGTLYLSAGKLKKRVFFQTGEPTFIESNLVQECLGQILVKRGRLTKEDCDESIVQMKKNKAKQGDTLIRMGLINPTELEEALYEQAREKIIEIFSWNGGQYRFVEEEKDKSSLTKIDLTPPQIILRGIRAGINGQTLKNDLAPFQDQVITVRKSSAVRVYDFKLAPWDQRLANEITGRRTLKDLLNLDNAREDDVYQLVYAFMITDAIEFETNEEQKDELRTLAKLRMFLNQVRDQDFFERLGIDRRQTSETVLFKKLSQKLAIYHPTASKLNPSKSPEITKTLESISGCMQEAFDTLSNEKKRKRYEQKLFYEDGIVPSQPEDIFDPELELHRIKIAIEQGDFDETFEKLDMLTKLFPNDWRFPTYYGWVQFKNASKYGRLDRDSVKPYVNQILAGLRLNEEKGLGHYFLGCIMKHIDDNDAALGLFEQAVAKEPELVEAERELRLMKMRRKKSGKSFIRWK